MIKKKKKKYSFFFFFSTASSLHPYLQNVLVFIHCVAILPTRNIIVCIFFFFFFFFLIFIRTSMAILNEWLTSLFSKILFSFYFLFTLHSFYSFMCYVIKQVSCFASSVVNTEAKREFNSLIVADCLTEKKKSKTKTKKSVVFFLLLLFFFFFFGDVSNIPTQYIISAVEKKYWKKKNRKKNIKIFSNSLALLCMGKRVKRVLKFAWKTILSKKNKKKGRGGRMTKGTFTPLEYEHAVNRKHVNVGTKGYCIP